DNPSLDNHCRPTGRSGCLTARRAQCTLPRSHGTAWRGNLFIGSTGAGQQPAPVLVSVPLTTPAVPPSPAIRRRRGTVPVPGAGLKRVAPVPKALALLFWRLLGHSGGVWPPRVLVWPPAPLVSPCAR